MLTVIGGVSPLNSHRRLVGPGIPLAMQLKVAVLPKDTSTSCGMITKTSPSWTSTSPVEIVLPEFCVHQSSFSRRNVSSRIQIQSIQRTLKAMTIWWKLIHNINLKRLNEMHWLYKDKIEKYSFWTISFAVVNSRIIPFRQCSLLHQS